MKGYDRFILFMAIPCLLQYLLYARNLSITPYEISKENLLIPILRGLTIVAFYRDLSSIAGTSD